MKTQVNGFSNNMMIYYRLESSRNPIPVSNFNNGDLQDYEIDFEMFATKGNR